MTTADDVRAALNAYTLENAARVTELVDMIASQELTIAGLTDTVADRDATIRRLRAKIRDLTNTPPNGYHLMVGCAPGPDNTEAYMQVHNTKAGRALDCRRTFDTDLPATFAASDAGSDVGKRTSIWSFKQNATQTAIQQTLRTVPGDHDLYLIYWHEPEDDFTTTAAKADYRARNEKVRAAVDAANEGREVPIKFWGCMMAYLPDRWDKLAYPDLWDGVAFDGYAWATDNAPRPAADIFREDFQHAHDMGFEDVGVGEFGNQWGTDYHNKGTLIPIDGWITDALAYFRAEEAVFACYFNKNLTMSRDSEYQALGSE